MELKIKSISMQSFKGIKQQTYNFDSKSANVYGCNGSGKSTLMSAFMWVFTDTDSLMTKNPNVIPIGESECTPTVEIELELDGKPILVAKKQKYKSKEIDGKTTASSTNTYLINGVDKTYKAFIEDLTERGIDMDRFILFSNPNAFMADTSKAGRDKMRKILFEMASDVSDADIANELGLNDLKALLEQGYKLEETKAINKSTIKKITDNNGKENEIINARIQGILESKVAADVKELESKKLRLMIQIEELERNISNSADFKSGIQRDIAKLELQREDILRQANAGNEKAIAEKDRQIVELDTQRASVLSRKSVLNVELNSLLMEKERVKESLENYRGLYKKVQNEVLDEKDLKCPTCGREYESDRIEEMKAQFEESKNERLNAYKTKGEELNKALAEKKTETKNKELQLADLDKEYEELSCQIESVKAEISMMPTKADSSVTTDIDAQIKQLEDKLALADDSEKDRLKTEIKEKETELNDINNKLAVVSRNSELDAQAEKLRAQRKQDEINKAKAEKVISEIEQVEKAKNEKLSASINSHFNIVSFKLFDFLKNGNYAETIELMIDGKPISSCANGSLIQLAKLDCLSGLQNFFNQHLPVFLEDAALITSNTSDRIKLDSQLIQLIATDNATELEIKTE